MSGPWEKRLDNLANGGRDWALPSHAELTENLEALNGALTRAASEPGLVGASGDAATASLDQAAQRAAAIIQTADAVKRATEKANVVRNNAQSAQSALPSGELSWGERALIGAAAAGSTIFLGPFSLIAGAAAMNNGDAAKAAMREAAARKAVQDASADLGAIDLPTEISVDSNVADSSSDASTPGGGTGPQGGSRPSARGSHDGGFSSYPDFDVDPIQETGQRPGVSVVPPGTVPPPGSTIIPTDPGPWPQGPTDHGSSGLVGSGGASLGGMPGGSGGLLGGSSTLAAGVGAAAVLGVGSKAALGSFGALGGAAGKGVAAGGLTGTPGANAGAAAGRGATTGPRAGSGGLLGGGGRAGAGAASERTGSRAGGRGRGAGRLPAAKGALVEGDGVSRGTGDARGASSGRGTGAAGSESAGRTGAQAAAGGRVGGAASGRAGADKRRRGRGLAGAIAPSIEDEVEYGPRSEAALAGGREPAVDEGADLTPDAD